MSKIVKISQGFTLIELMIVIAIIGVLAAVALPMYADYTARAQLTEALTFMSGYKSAVLENYSSDGECPSNTDTAVFGVAKASDIHGSYIQSITLLAGTNTCVMQAQMKTSGVATGIQGKHLSLIMDIPASNNAASGVGAYTWTCRSDDIENKYLPAACRQ